ncbi:MAG: nuclear transport factor 2 family protein [Parvularculaceae bacterium]
MTLSKARFEAWLGELGEAWEARDAERFATQFAEDALFYRTPFDAPKRGRDEIAKAFTQAVARQRDIDFGARILYVQARLGAAHWSCAFTREDNDKRVHLDGILVIQTGDDGSVRSFREWWHTDEK